MDALVTTEWLAGELGAPDLVLLDASYTATLPGAPVRDPRAEYAAGHIPGSRFLDLDTLVDASDPLPSMLPPAALFVERMRALGVGNDDRVVLYDAGLHHTACRAWWVCRMFGLGNVALLDGGINKWKAEQRALSDKAETAERSDFELRPALAEVRTLAQMHANIASGAEQVADARSAARFTGAEPDPRAEVAAGHIPGSKNIPYPRFFNEDGTWKAPEHKRAGFEESGIDLARPIVTTCGSGITAAILAFGAHLLDNEAALYDGSWTEWGSRPETAKALGPA